MTKRIVAVLAVVALSLVACDDDGASVRDLGGSASSGSGSGSGSGSASGVASGSGTEAAGPEADCEPEDTDGTLNVALDEFSVVPEEDEITSGPVKLLAVNAGEVTHELVIVQAPSVEALPLDGERGVDEEALEPGREIAEIEAVEPGESCLLEIDLEPATYVLFCNVVDEGEKQPRSHYLRGMRTRLKVS